MNHKKEIINSHKDYIDSSIMNDDHFMEAVLKDNYGAIEEIIQAVLDDSSLEVLNVSTVKQRGNLGTRFERYFILAHDYDGRLYNISLDKWSENSIYEKVSEQSFFEPVKDLPEGIKVDDIEKIIHILLLDYSPFNIDASLFMLEMEAVPVDDDGNQIEEETIKFPSETIVINTTFDEENTPLGDLIRDLNETDPNKMVYPSLRERALKLKENK